ncbi:MAG: DUF1579 domain-containing protein [Eubacteriaceae bacterium]|nr:DUF1579 domain-containing protein [Eubacteriaceae bacterium]
MKNKVMVLLAVLLFAASCSGSPGDTSKGPDGQELANTQDGLAGDWIWEAKIDGFYYSLSFEESGEVVYKVGWVDSELAGVYEGVYEATGGILTLDTEGIDPFSQEPLNPLVVSFAYVVDNSNLILSKNGSDDLFNSADSMVFLKNDFGWMGAYVEYLENILASHDDVETTTCSLANIDADNTPELIINYGISASGGEVCTYFAGEMSSISVSENNISYIPNSGLLLDIGGRMDVYYDAVYSLSQGLFTIVGVGNYGADNNSDVQYSETGDPIYSYFWNGDEVGADEYSQLLAEVFDKDSSILIYSYLQGMSLEETIELLSN